VERVDLYTRQTFYVLLWTSGLFILLGQTNNADGRHQGAMAAAAIGGVVVLVAGTAVLRDVVDLYPQTGPLPWRSLTPFLVLTAVYFGVGLGLPADARGAVTAITFVTLGWSVSGLVDRQVTVVLMVVLAVIPVVASREWWYALAGVAIGAFLMFTVRVSLWLLQVVFELDAARGAQAALAVAEERLRFSRDLHDVMGRRLSAIAVKSELAATLADRSDPGAAAQMMEVRGVAHAAMREARELARGYRTTDLAQELEGSRSLLESAGISVELAVDDVPAGWHEAAAWVVREAVTNVLRHSAATAVAIRYAGSELAVVNDGVVSSTSTGGSGLAGLRERLAPLGAGLTVTGSDSSFAVVATLPGRGPAEPA
jgi:two-component system sensor histidine kinase DesK